MQPSSSSSSSSSSNSAIDFQQLWGGWMTSLTRLHDDSKVAQVVNSRIGQYLSSRPFLALTVMLFSAMAALPVGLFLTFALVTMMMSAVGFVFLEVFLLCVGGLTLLCVFSGIAFFSLLASATINALYITIGSLLNRYYPHLTKRGLIQRKESE